MYFNGEGSIGCTLLGLEFLKALGESPWTEVSTGFVSSKP